MEYFPSEAWCQALIEAINADPETSQAGLGWEGDFGAAVLEVPGLPQKNFVVYCRPESGIVGGFRRLDDLEELEELAPAYRVRADYATWKGLIQGTQDPIEALILRKLRFHGHLEPIIARARFREILRRALARVTTAFSS